MSYSFDHHHSGWHTVGAASISVGQKVRIYFTNKNAESIQTLANGVAETIICRR